jgi:hypothetical protein
MMGRKGDHCARCMMTERLEACENVMDNEEGSVQYTDCKHALHKAGRYCVPVYVAEIYILLTFDVVKCKEYLV